MQSATRAHRLLSRRPLLQRRPYSTPALDVPQLLKNTAQSVKNTDYDSFICGSLLPPKSRDAYFVLKAWNIEVATIQDVTSDPRAALGRLKFWRETVKACFEGKPPSGLPLATLLAGAIEEFNLSPIHFKRILDRREKDIRNQSIGTIEDMEAFGEETASSLLYLTLQLNGINHIPTDHAASHVGKALGITTLLRSTAYHAQKRKNYLPVSIMAKHGLSEESLFRGQAADPNSAPGKALHEVAFESASSAKVHLDKAREMSKDLSKDAKRVLLPAALAEDFLTTLQKKDFNLFDASLAKRNPLVIFRLGWNSYRNTF
ncbi:hypothetical protein PROFUN_15039 [Planoprotostelium fungivorum]|uniref:15-cis-phytoene synthase n=1 Tax=Planoprotostelium fungivorum TaxID=1890364 RepID=A0A2P6MZM8_9EUKA|nr:hypothetical protein PROFUN_15039 [Planoprotostelium fungivorum]